MYVPMQRDELEWFFRHPDAPPPDTSAGELSRWRATRRAFRSARFAALRRYWIAEGSRAFYLATSPISRDAMARGRGQCAEEILVTLNFASWNRIAQWLKSLQHLRAVA
jgi:hypothetical protein